MKKTFSQKHWPEEDTQAVAYQLNFVSMAYMYDTDMHSDYFKTCCENSKSLCIHYRDFEYPKSKAILRPYHQLSFFYYAISEELKNAILEFGIDDKEEDVFRPVWTRKHDVPISYSIEPKHIMKPIAKENNYIIQTICEEHNIIRAQEKGSVSAKKYDGLGPPVFISEEAAKDLHDFNYTFEFFGPGGYLLRDVIVSKRVCDFILSLYPKAEFRPVVIKKI